ncbi:hypothetical protein M8312_08415 [Sphingomonas sp. KRR8]|uniref:hypothetical protein n=1 Tax=Sphingomonas sp. KRR8 TaxID=2942996 RepID=UPI0020224DCB|nr:hypothetical protein [Sphingomonas sp. KRR8]URD59839.1 hypothetical protein M8312_08415 [Sphingomonas sp. KRR8]
MRRLTAATILLVLATPALGAGPGTAQNFLDRANRLKSKGPLALFDGDIGKLKAEAIAAGKSIGADRVAAEKAGRPKQYCSPEPKASLGQNEFLAGLEAIPAAQRARISLKQAMLLIIQKKYPCPR